MNIEDLLDETTKSELEKLNATPYDSKEYAAVADTVDKLMARKIDLEKVKSEQLMKEKQLADEKKDRIVKNAIGVAGIVLPLIVTIWGTKVSLKFEEEGTVTTMMGRGFIGRLLPRK